MRTFQMRLVVMGWVVGSLAARQTYVDLCPLASASRRWVPGHLSCLNV